MAAGASSYSGRASPYWYDAAQFFELLQAAGTRLVREFIEQLDGCSGTKAGKIAADFKSTRCNVLSREQAAALLRKARAQAKPVTPNRLGRVGKLNWLPTAYAREEGTTLLGSEEPQASVPFVVEAWASAERSSDTDAEVPAFVNRTPITGEMRAYKEPKSFSLFGCGIRNEWELPGRGEFTIYFNLTTPYCPITTDGKEPDLSPFRKEIFAAMCTAIKRSRRELGPLRIDEAGGRLTQKSVIVSNIDEGIAKASGNGAFRFSQRQLFYVLRPIVIDALGAAPTWGNFEGIITDYENEHGHILGMVRDPRGTLYHPYKGEDIPLGTLNVENYKRPEWVFSKIVYIEKEGFFEALKAVGWPERNDCALMTSKGFSTRAARDLLDLLADTEEPITIFCVHDADAEGTMIFQALQEETRARPRRRAEIINLGLEPWEALGMGLTVEPVTDRKKRAPVAEYILARSDGDEWDDWLQENRIELNAMTTPQFLAWLDAKMQEHGGGAKLVPPTPVLVESFHDSAEDQLRRRIVERVLRAAGVDKLVHDALRSVLTPDPEQLAGQVAERLSREPDAHWEKIVASIAENALQR